MTEINARGYILATTIGYLQETAGQERAGRILAGLSPELRQAITKVAPAAWYPISLLAEANRAIVEHLAENNEERARDLLLDCGRYMGHEASNTFLRIFMRMLTPTLFAKKLPTVWKRDFTGGRLELDVTDGRLVCRIFEAHGHDHIGPVSAGWLGFALKAMGKPVEKTIMHDWSLANPNVDGVGFELVWKD